MNQLQEFKDRIKAYRRYCEDVWSRFDTLLSQGHAIVDYARSGRARAKSDLKLLERVEKYTDRLLAETPVYA